LIAQPIADVIPSCSGGDLHPGELASAKFKFTQHHVLYGKLRPYLAKIACPDFSGICSTDILPILPGPQLERRFLCYFLRQPSLVEYANARASGANLPRLSPTVLAGFEIPLPPIAAQRRIADVLDTTNALRIKRRAALAELDTLTQSIFLDVFGDPATNPKRWPETTLGKIIEFVGGSQPPRETFSYEPAADRIRLVQIRDFKTDAFATFIPRNLARRFFEADDVMIGRYGPPVFQILRGLSGSYNVALMKASPRGDVLKDFIFHLLQESRLHSFVVARSERTAGQSGVNLELLENYPAFLPPLDVQREFSRRAAAVDNLRRTQRVHLAELDALFASLQDRAFRGEL
jgi:type I restriction enzyme, S subunit